MFTVILIIPIYYNKVFKYFKFTHEISNSIKLKKYNIILEK